MSLESIDIATAEADRLTQHVSSAIGVSAEGRVVSAKKPAAPFGGRTDSQDRMDRPAS